MSPSMFEVGFKQQPAELTLAELPTSGQIPTWLDGVLLRNGPAQFQIGSRALTHWFDGQAMLHQFAFQDGRVSYRNRFLACRSRREAEQGRMTFTEFATDPCRSWFQRLQGFAAFGPTDSAKVSLARLGDHFLALGETPLQIEFDPETLESVGVLQYERRTLGRMTTAHPHQDNGIAYNLVVAYGAISRYKIYAIAEDEPELQPKLVASVPVRNPAYLHSFALTPNYFVITEFPFTVNATQLLLWLRPFIENFRWQPRQGTRFWVIERATGRLVGKFKTDPFFAFHHANAFEADGDLVIDLVAYPDADIIQHYYLRRLALARQAIPHGQLRRVQLNLARQTVRWQTISKTALEMNHIPYARDNMRPDYPAVYGLGIHESRPHEFYNQIVRIAVPSGQTQRWQQPDTFPGEPVIALPPNAGPDDEGLLLSVVLDARAGNSFLLLLDPRTMTEVGRATVPQPITPGFHGAYFDRPVRA